jgi:alkyl sulfatase BDS1-like metallo-beta-lactamase superfamily hydrolase
VLGESTFDAEVEAGNIELSGSAQDVAQFLGLLDRFERWYRLATP